MRRRPAVAVTNRFRAAQGLQTPRGPPSRHTQGTRHVSQAVPSRLLLRPAGATLRCARVLGPTGLARDGRPLVLRFEGAVNPGGLTTSLHPNEAQGPGTEALRGLLRARSHPRRPRDCGVPSSCPPCAKCQLLNVRRERRHTDRQDSSSSALSQSPVPARPSPSTWRTRERHLRGMPPGERAGTSSLARAAGLGPYREDTAGEGPREVGGPPTPRTGTGSRN